MLQRFAIERGITMKTKISIFKVAIFCLLLSAFNCDSLFAAIDEAVFASSNSDSIPEPYAFLGVRELTSVQIGNYRYRAILLSVDENLSALKIEKIDVSHSKFKTDVLLNQWDLYDIKGGKEIFSTPFAGEEYRSLTWQPNGELTFIYSNNYSNYYCRVAGLEKGEPSIKLDPLKIPAISSDQNSK
jgi:hypothetical protein